MNLKLAWSNWKDARAVKRAEKKRRRQERADRTPIVVRGRMSVPEMIQTGWLVTKIGAVVFGGWWAYSHAPSLSLITGGASVVRDAVSIGGKAKEKAGEAADGFYKLSKATGQAIVAGVGSAWNNLPWPGAPKSERSYAGDIGVDQRPRPAEEQRYAPPVTPSAEAIAEAARRQAAVAEAARQEAARREAARQEAVRAARLEEVDRMVARREAARLEEIRRETAKLEAARREAARQQEAAAEERRRAAAATPSAAPQPPANGFFNGPNWESKTAQERADLHWRGRSIHSATPGWTIAPCGDRRGSMWVHVPIGTREGPPNCRFYETRYFASELPAPETARRTYLAVDDGWYWRTMMTNLGVRWVLTKMPDWKGQPSIRSLDVTPEQRQRRDRYGFGGPVY